MELWVDNVDEEGEEEEDAGDEHPRWVEDVRDVLHDGSWSCGFGGYWILPLLVTVSVHLECTPYGFPPMCCSSKQQESEISQICHDHGH